MRILLAILYLIGTSDRPQNTKIVTTLKSTSERIKAHGYPVEEHSVETTDGYVLKMFRIPYSYKLQNKNSVKPVVFIKHGLFSSSDAWLAVGPDSGIPFVLADLGYDVWLGNARGNRYSRNNTRFSVHHPRFWRFSWHEIGVYDVSAMIDYILYKTKQESLHFVGHSQGTTVFFVLMSVKPEYNKKIKTAHMLAPTAYMDHLTDRNIKTLAPYLGREGIYTYLFESREFLPDNELFTLLGYNICGIDVQYPYFCSELMEALNLPPNTNKTAIRIIAETHPAGGSTNQILHYLQGVISGHFVQYDFGIRKNLRKYGQLYPPDYEIENISSEVHLYYCKRDKMSDVRDVLRLAKRLPNLKGLHLAPDPTWDHIDFSMAYQVKEVVNNRIASIMNEYETRNYKKETLLGDQ